MSDAEFTAIMEQALQLSPAERARLANTLWTSVAAETREASQADEAFSIPTLSTPERSEPASDRQLLWGERMVALLDSLDLSAWETEDLDDPVAWVERKRREQRARRGNAWDQSE